MHAVAGVTMLPAMSLLAQISFFEMIGEIRTSEEVDLAYAEILIYLDWPR